MSIPGSVEALTAPWFGETLGTEVRSVEVIDAHSGTTGRARVRIDADGPPETLFVKLQPFLPEQRQFLAVTGLGVAEARFYAAVGGELPVRSPEVWHAACDEEDGSFIMVLEDLTASGCRFPGPEDADVLAVASSLMDELAALHATFWEQELPWLGTHALSSKRRERPASGKSGGSADGSAGSEKKKKGVGGGAGVVRSALDQFSGEMPPAFRSLGELYVSAYRDIAAMWSEGDATLIHGDDHIGNLFVDGGRTGFFDWAVASRFPGMRDVSYFLCNSLPTDVRRAEEHALLTRYREGLARRKIQLDETLQWQQYRTFSVYSWVSATTTAAMGSQWQPAEIGRSAMIRTTQAIVDLDVLSLLRERLALP